MYGKFGRVNPARTIWPTIPAIVMRDVITRESAQIYHDSARLEAALLEKSVSPVKIKQIELALASDVVKSFLTGENKQPSSIELNNLLFSIEDCGLADEDARILLDELLYSVGIEHILKNYQAVKNVSDIQKAELYVPSHVYRKRLKEILNIIELKKESDLTQEMIDDVDLFALCQIGEAHYILALMYKEGFGIIQSDSLAERHLRKAMALGYPAAFAISGDRKYERNDFDSAYEEYTKPGAIALDGDRKRKMNTLLKAKKFANQVCTALGAVYALIVVAMFFLMSRGALTGGNPIVMSIFIVLLTLSFLAVLFIHYLKPMKDLRHWGIVFAILFAVYLVLVLLV